MYFKRIIMFTLAFFMSTSVIPGFWVMASSIDNGAKIMRVEYQGKVLSKDKQNPTVLEWTGYGASLSLDLIGNSACAALNNDSNINIEYFANDHFSGGGHSCFDSDGKATYYVKTPASSYVGNDVFEVYWNIIQISNSASPKYYITYNQGETNYIVPQGNVPTIVRAELNNVELSKDKNHPTIIPYYNTIKLIGNSACISKTIDVVYRYHGEWSGSGWRIYFNSYAIGSCAIFVAFEHGGNNGKELYNETVEIEFVADNNDNNETLEKSPAYYVFFLDEESSLLDVELNGLFQTVRLSGNQLIVEAKKDYVFCGSDIVLKDLTENEEYKLGIWYENSDCQGCMTNRIVYSNLPLKKENIYELTIPAKSIYFSSAFDSPDDYNNLKYNREYTTELILEGSLTFSDIKDGDWAYPYVKELTEKRIINGYEDGTFRPNGLVTRSEFAKIMTLALQIPLVDGDIEESFADVDKSNWAFRYIETVKRYLTGYYDGDIYYFKGAAPAVREDMAVALVKAMGLENQSVDLGELTTIFSDCDSISQNLRKHVLIAYKNKLIDGYPDGTFGPQRTITRAETVALLSKVYKSDALEKVTFD